MWRVVVAMEQRNSTCHAFGPRYSTETEGGRGKERKGESLQLRKGGMHIEKDRAIALLDFAFSPESQAARRATPAILRSQVACGALTGEITAIRFFWVVFIPEIAETSAIYSADAGTRRLVEVTSPNKFFLEANEAHSKLWLQSQSFKQTPQTCGLGL